MFKDQRNAVRRALLQARPVKRYKGASGIHPPTFYQSILEIQAKTIKKVLQKIWHKTRKLRKERIGLEIWASDKVIFCNERNELSKTKNQVSEVEGRDLPLRLYHHVQQNGAPRKWNRALAPKRVSMTRSSIQVGGTPTLSLTNRATCNKTYRRPGAKSDSKRTAKIIKHFDMLWRFTDST